MDDRSHTILVVEDDDSFRRVVTAHLEKAGHEVVSAQDGESAIALLEESGAGRFALVLTDVRMPGMSGLDLLRRITSGFPELPVIILSAHATVENAIEALRTGAVDYLTKPFGREELLNRVGQALELQDLRRENRRLQTLLRDRYDLEGMVGESGAIQDVYRIARRVSATDTTVLIQGESGTGKEMLARSIHLNSPRSEGPFVAVNCGAIPASLLESELFGHMKGAFTGADRTHEGKFQNADGGTILLDEVAELPLEVQTRLLRVLQEHTVDMVGAEHPVPVDVRIIAATNRDLREELAAGRFREDLYYRLCVVPVKMPPLRDRREDIPLLFDHFLKKYCRELGRPLPTVDRRTYARLQDHSWPGNVRELENTVQRLLVMVSGDRIGADDLPETLGAPPAGFERLVEGLLDAGASVESIEKALIRAALDRHDGNQTRAAKALGITRNTLIYRMQKYDIEANHA